MSETATQADVSHVRKIKSSGTPVVAGCLLAVGGFMFAGWAVASSLGGDGGILASLDKAQSAISVLAPEQKPMVDLPAPVQTETTQPATIEPEIHSKTRVYIIEWGDTLTSISAETGISIDALVAQNNIMNPDLIYAGSALVIPQ